MKKSIISKEAGNAVQNLIRRKKKAHFEKKLKHKKSKKSFGWKAPKQLLAS